jgi:hypothetical protein
MIPMAGPLSSEEIEDVVSSVRRLVSNELSPRKLSRDLNADRLLLTPSLRVVSEARPLAPLILDAPVEEQPVHPEPVADAPADDAVELIEAEWEDEIWAQPEVVSLGEVALGAEEAEVLLPQAEAAEDLAAEVEQLPESWAEVGPDWVEAEPIPFVPMRHRAEALAARHGAGEGGEPPRADSDFATDTPSAPHPMQDEPTAGQSLPVDDDHEEPGVVDAPLLDADRAAATDEAAAQRSMPTEILDADGTELAVLDEAALQEMVRQMIREELQGDLGERITRNVRKLVRAEINRALIARDLD